MSCRKSTTGLTERCSRIVRREHEQQCVGRGTCLDRPDYRRHVEPDGEAVERDLFARRAVVDHDFERSPHADHGNRWQARCACSPRTSLPMRLSMQEEALRHERHLTLELARQQAAAQIAEDGDAWIVTPATDVDVTSASILASDNSAQDCFGLVMKPKTEIYLTA